MYSLKKLQKAIDTTPWPGPGLCLGWVTDVFENFGLLVTHYATAKEAKAAWCNHSMKDLAPGMVIAWKGPTDSHAGHIVIYIDDNHVYSSERVSTIVVRSLSATLAAYSNYGTPTCGWCMGAQFSKVRKVGGSHTLLLTPQGWR